VEYLSYGLHNIVHVNSLLLIAASVLFGVIFGAIPGLTATLGIALLLPFTYEMGPYNGLACLLGIYVGATSGGLISATLIGIPGTGASIVTTFDGYPMAQQGKANQALSLGCFSSFVGGVISMIMLMLISPLLARLALKFGPWEYFSLGIFGLTIVVSISSKNLIKGLLAGSLGVAITLPGQDPLVAIPRYAFGFTQMEGGFALLPTLLGFFAITQLFGDVESVAEQFSVIRFDPKYRIFPPLAIVRTSIGNFIRSSLLGTWIGILPGAGGSIASFLAYDQAKKASKTPEAFGTGHYEGVIASETANNAVTGGALIPLMTLGIPGDMVTAVILGGLLIHGLRPGPMLFQDNADVVGSIFVALFIANVMMFILQSGLMRFFAKIILVPKHILLPIVGIMCVVGTYSVNNRIFDLWVLIIFGFVGYILIKNKFNLGPIVLGYILGPLIETNWRLGLMAARGDYLPFLTRPLSALLLVMALGSILFPVIMSKFGNKKNHAQRA